MECVAFSTGRPSFRWMRVCLRGIGLALLLIALGLAAGGPAFAQAPTTYANGELIVRFRTDVPNVMLASARLSASLQTIDRIETLDLELVSVEPGKEAALISELSANPLVAYVGPNYLAHIAGEPNDPAWWRQWNMSQMDAAGAWDFTSGTNLIIAVVDTGVDLTHPELSGKLVSGYDFVHGDDEAQDDHGHGTHVAGVAAAIGNNGIGIAGLSWGARIMPLKVLDSSGDGAYFDIIQAIQYAADHGARVINLSLGGSQADPNLLAAVEYARDKGCLVVAATGNQGGALLYPAAYDVAFAVAATTDRQARPSYSNYGAGTDIAAPGGTEAAGIYSLAPDGGYATMYGTSMAAPHVSGLAALIWSLSPSLSPAQVVSVIEETAVKVGTDSYDNAGWNEKLGHGEIHAAAAVGRVVGTVAPTATPTRTRPPAATATVTPTATPQTETVDIPLNAGWNLVSFNVQPGDERIEVLTSALNASLELVLNYRCDQGGLSYYPDLPAGMSTLQSLQAGRGYWVKMRNAATWRVTGRPVDQNATLALCQGWNLAGYLPAQSYTVPFALSSLGSALEAVLGYENARGLSYYAELPSQFNSLQAMKPGSGYWIYTNQPAVLDYPAD
jgi:thermitase